MCCGIFPISLLYPIVILKVTRSKFQVGGSQKVQITFSVGYIHIYIWIYLGYLTLWYTMIYYAHLGTRRIPSTKSDWSDMWTMCWYVLPTSMAQQQNARLGKDNIANKTTYSIIFIDTTSFSSWWFNLPTQLLAIHCSDPEVHPGDPCACCFPWIQGLSQWLRRTRTSKKIHRGNGLSHG